MCLIDTGGGSGFTAEGLAGKCLGRDPTAEIEAIIFREKFLVELARFRGKITASAFPSTDENADSTLSFKYEIPLGSLAPIPTYWHLPSLSHTINVVVLYKSSY